MISIIIPALNEEQNLRATVENVIGSAQAVQVSPIEIIVVNDGSTDRTAEIIKELEEEYSFIRSIHHPLNQGMGASFLEGAYSAKYDKVTLFAADNVTTPYMIKNLLKNTNTADLVIAYFLNTESRTQFRHILSILFCNLYIFTFNLHLKYTHGPAVYPKKLLKNLKLNSRGYSMFVEMNIKLLKQGIEFCEVDGYIYPDAKRTGAVKLKTLIEVVSNYFLLVYEIYFKDKNLYNKKPKRVFPSLGLEKKSYENESRRSLSN